MREATSVAQIYLCDGRDGLVREASLAGRRNRRNPVLRPQPDWRGYQPYRDGQAEESVPSLYSDVLYRYRPPARRIWEPGRVELALAVPTRVGFGPLCAGYEHRREEGRQGRSLPLAG